MRMIRAHLKVVLPMTIIILAITGYWLIVETDNAMVSDDIEILTDTLVVRLTDLNGNAVEGAKIASWTDWSDTRPGTERARGRFVRRITSVISREDGTAILEGERLFENLPADYVIPLYAYHEDRKIGGLIQVLRKDLGRQIDLKLEPVCHVKGKLTCSGLKKVGLQLKWTNAYVYWNSLRPFKCKSSRQCFQFYLPPGQYMLSASGEGAQDVHREIEIEPGQQDLELQIDLPVDQLALLQGKPAPEFKKIKGWKNGDPISMKGLLGKVVLLDFWGYWCPPCIQKMPKLIKLHQEFKDEGLVIIAIHNDSVASIEELDRKLKMIREKHWGSNLPFLIALDGGGKTPIFGTNINADGATTAAYGITAYPTVLLIDRQGTLVQEFDPENVDHIAKLQRLLDVKTSLLKEFNKIYCLRKDQALKRIDLPFIELRKQVLNEANYSYTSFRWSEKLNVRENRPAFRKVTLEDILERIVGLSKFDYHCSDELLALEIPGDWIVKMDASKDAILRDLETIISKYSGRLVHFKKRQTVRDIIVTQGAFEFNPLSGTFNDTCIHVFSDKLDADERGGGGQGSLNDFLTKLGLVALNTQIINRTKDSDDVRISWFWHLSGYLKKLSVGSDRIAKFSLLLNNLSRQTSLSFSKEQQKVDVWHVVENNHKDKTLE